MRSYINFIVMITVSATFMFGLMYLNTYQPSHVWFSQTRLFMTFIMAGCMALVMLFFMRHMYKNKQKNIAVILVSVLLMVVSTYLVRQQIPIGDVKWMRAMIPHHSIAILTSNRADLKDPEVKKLAEEIIKAQEREIAEMKRMIARLEND